MEVISIIIVISIIWGIIPYTNEKRQQGMRDEVAKEVLAVFNFEKEKKDILEISGHFVSKEYRCPRCSGVLLLRNGIYGKFLGCSHYPNCTFTRNA